MNPIEIVVLLIYLSFAIDLLGFPVPSEASTLQLFFPKEETGNGMAANLLSKIQNLPLISKIILLLIPTGIGIFTYLLPMLVILISPLENIFGSISNQTPFQLAIVGIVIAISGRLLSIYSAIQIRKKKEQTAKKDLKTKNFFQLSRNPILLGLHLTFIGLAFIFPVRAMFFGGLIYFANMHFKVILEEHFLKAKFGSSFIQYCQSTNRYL